MSGSPAEPPPRPVPTLRGEERLWFDAAREGRLVHQRCQDCQARIWYPRVLCPTCGSERLDVVDSAGRGAVHSFTVLHRAGHPSRAADVPYAVLLVDLDEGVRVLADLDGDPGTVAVGTRVEAVFQEVAPDLVLPRFRAVPA